MKQIRSAVMYLVWGFWVALITQVFWRAIKASTRFFFKR